MTPFTPRQTDQGSGVPASPSGCQPTASAAEEASSQSGSPNAVLLELAERCEQALSADRELDCRIHCAIEGLSFDACLAVVPNLADWIALYYTASLDAAMTLVPEPLPGWRRSRFELAHSSGDPAWFAKLLYLGPPIKMIDAHGIAATPALALCAAALRARAS
jgi:hypothetical protein